MTDFLKNFMLQQALQAVLGLLGVALNNPASSTVRVYEKTLLTLRNMTLQIYPLDKFPLPQPGAPVIAAIGEKPTPHK